MKIAPSDAFNSTLLKETLKKAIRKLCCQWIANSFLPRLPDEAELCTLYNCALKLTFSWTIDGCSSITSSLIHKKRPAVSPPERLPEFYNIPAGWDSRFLQTELRLLKNFPIRYPASAGVRLSICNFLQNSLSSGSGNRCDALSFEDWINLYESSLSWKLIREGNTYRIKSIHSSRSRDGKYYTPQPVVHYIVKNVLTPLCRGKTPYEILDIRAIDPAMGCGQFLRSAALFLTDAITKKLTRKKPGSPKKAHSDEEFYLDKHNPKEVMKLVIRNCLYGVDTDPFAVFLARWLLEEYPYDFKLNKQTAGIKNIRRPPHDLSRHLKVGNSLAGGIFKEEKRDGDGIPASFTPFLWHEEFPEIFHERKGFHAVVGNPPWISFGLRGTGKLQKNELEYYRKHFIHSAEYKISSYVLFMERSIRLLAPGGYHSFIVPDSFLNGRYFSKIRKYILEKTELRKVVLLDQSGWKGIHTGRNVIYVLQKPRLKAALQTPAENNEKLKSLTKKEPQKYFQALYIKNYDELFERRKGYLQRVQPILETFPYRLRLVFNKQQDTFIKKMDEGSVLIRDIVKFYSGLIGKKGKKSIIFPAPSKNHNDFGRLIDSGKCLDRYRLTYRGLFIKKDPRLYKSGYTTQIYENPKIFLNQTGYTLKAYMDTEDYYCLNNLHVGYTIDNRYSLAFITALLNSQTLNAYYNAISMEYRRPLAQTDIETIETLPVPVVPFMLPLEDRIRWIQLFPYGEILYDNDSTEEKNGAAGNNWSDRKQKAAKYFLNDLQNLNHLFQKVRNESGDGRTVLHDWLHTASSILMEYYRGKYSRNNDYIQLACLPGTKGLILWNKKGIENVTNGDIENFIEMIAAYLYGICSDCQLPAAK